MNKPSIYGRRRKIMSEYKDLKNKTHAIIQRVIGAENKQDSFTEEAVGAHTLKVVLSPLITAPRSLPS